MLISSHRCRACWQWTQASSWLSSSSVPTNPSRGAAHNRCVRLLLASRRAYRCMRVRVAVRFAAGGLGYQRWFSAVVLIGGSHLLGASCRGAEGIADCFATGDHATVRRAASSRCAAPTLSGGRHMWLSSVAVIGGYHWWLSSIAVSISAVGHAVGSWSCCCLLSQPLWLIYERLPSLPAAAVAAALLCSRRCSRRHRPLLLLRPSPTAGAAL